MLSVFFYDIHIFNICQEDIYIHKLLIKYMEHIQIYYVLLYMFN